MSPPLTEEDFERLYQEVVKQPAFYDDEYAEAWAEAPYAMMADMVVRLYSPSRVLDMGCGVGYVVKNLRDRGIDAVGIEYSQAFLHRAAPQTRRHLLRGDVAALPFTKGAFDLVLCMEVLEHLPIRLARQTIEEINRATSSQAFVTIPSFGPNDYGPYGLTLYDDSFFEDAKWGRPFRRIVLDEKGRPHCGHLTLATYGWWTDAFLTFGLARSEEMEAHIYYTYPQFHELKRQIYALSRIRDNHLEMGHNEMGHLGSGWYALEDWKEGDGPCRWMSREATLFLLPQGHEERLSLELYPGPRALIHDVCGELLVEQKGEDDAYQTLSRQPFTFTPGEWLRPSFPLPTNWRKGRHLKITLVLEKDWLASRIAGTADSRRLGMALRRARLE